MDTQLNSSSSELTGTVSSSPLLLQKHIRRSLLAYYPWLVIGLCSFFLFYKYVLQVSPSVMTKDLMADFKINGAGLGNLAATYFYAYLIVQLFVGPLLDRYSPRYLTAIAILLCAAAAFVFANTHSLFVAEISRALMGAGTAFATVSYMKMSAIWFKPNQVAFVDGLLATAAMAGALCGQVPLTMLVTQTGWRASLIYCAFFGVVLAVLFLLLIRDKNKNTLSVSSTSPGSTIQLKDIYALLKNKKNWLLTFYSGLAFTPIAVLGGLWGNPFFEAAYHVTATQAAYFTSLIFIGLAIGSPLCGYFAGRSGQSVKVMVIGTSIALGSLIVAIYITTIPFWLLGSLLFTFGLGTGVFMLSFPLGKQLNRMGVAATVVALINTGEALCGSFTEPFVGKMLDLMWDGQIVNGVHVFSASHYQFALTVLPLYLLLALWCLHKLKNSV